MQKEVLIVKNLLLPGADIKEQSVGAGGRPPHKAAPGAIRSRRIACSSSLRTFWGGQQVSLKASTAASACYRDTHVACNLLRTPSKGFISCRFTAAALLPQAASGADAPRRE